MDNKRILSIDVFRGLTIFLMVFVNDLMPVTGIPSFLKHAGADANTMTFVDVVFPAFLFIVGISIPLAMGVRIARGENPMLIGKHVFIRTAGLIILGLFMVNSWEMEGEPKLISRTWWDEEQFELAKSRIINNIKRNDANPNYLAYTTFNKLAFGEENPLAVPSYGTLESVEAISLEELKAYYENNLSPSLASLHMVGPVPSADIKAAFEGISTRWESKDVVLPEFEIPANPESPAIYFVDVPGAKQSVIQIGNLALTRSHSDYDAVQTMNYKLGGSFSGFLNLILREEKGFTYGARSSFSGNNIYGTFQASSSVRSNASAFVISVCSRRPSMICHPMVKTGFIAPIAA